MLRARRPVRTWTSNPTRLPALETLYRACSRASLTLCGQCLAVLYKLKIGELVTSIPTIGFNVEVVKYKNLEMTIWDVGGQDKIRALWRCVPRAHTHTHAHALHSTC